MTLSKRQRQQIFYKFNGLCAYSGTPLESDWQVEHIKPIFRNWCNGKSRFPHNDILENLVPCQKLINHYKHQLSLEEFRTLYLSNLHTKLANLPKNPRTEKSKKRIAYMRKIASYFGITETIPFSGTFYFETIDQTNN